MEKILTFLIDDVISTLRKKKTNTLLNPHMSKRYLAGVSQFATLEHLLLFKLTFEFYLRGGENIIMEWNDIPIYKKRTRFEFTRFTLELYTPNKSLYKKKYLLTHLRNFKENLPNLLISLRMGWFEIKENGGYYTLMKRNTFRTRSILPQTNEHLFEDSFWKTLLVASYPREMERRISVSQLKDEKDLWVAITADEEMYTLMKKYFQLRSAERLSLEELFPEEEKG